MKPLTHLSALLSSLILTCNASAILPDHKSLCTTDGLQCLNLDYPSGTTSAVVLCQGAKYDTVSICRAGSTCIDTPLPHCGPVSNLTTTSSSATYTIGPVPTTPIPIISWPPGGPVATGVVPRGCTAGEGVRCVAVQHFAGGNVDAVVRCEKGKLGPGNMDVCGRYEVCVEMPTPHCTSKDGGGVAVPVVTASVEADLSRSAALLDDAGGEAVPSPDGEPVGVEIAW